MVMGIWFDVANDLYALMDRVPFVLKDSYPYSSQQGGSIGGIVHRRFRYFDTQNIADDLPP